MGNSGWTADPDYLLVPPDATDDDSRIFIGGNQDPILASLGQTEGIVFYFGNGRAFIISVEKQTFHGIPAAGGRLHIWARTESALFQMFDMDCDPTTNTVSVNMFQDSVFDAAENSVVGIVADVVGLGIDHQPTDTEKFQDVYLFGAPIARGDHNHVEVAANSAAIGTTETVVLTLPSETYYAGRTYEVTLKSGIFGSAATNFGEFRVRKTNAAGQDLGEFFWYPTLGAGAQVMAAHGSGLCFTVGASDVTAALVLTLKSSAGTVTHFGNASNPRSLRIKDVSDNVNFSAFPVLA